ncbi:MAG: TRAP transporter large permease [Synergistaceae bacterium]|jgi:C4-dicarboxylate transporter DctM subunit|nr:TRAP transporter large permease [Acholeplasmataceae bacterium]MDD3318464.1 TRAP transporter large permease [Synergistaceae bacterium]MDD3672544.1 TRAP transporter large permease [Synergistaceae bacterium]MDY0284057.1 TRAP transporter large permease [Synergistaceae bacterium]
MLGMLLGLLVLFFAMGTPIYIALSLPSFVNILASGYDGMVMIQRFFGGIDRFSLMAIPFFILAADVMGRGGMSKRIINLAEVFLGRFYGGTATATVVACLVFGALSGSSPATVCAIGGITYPMLLKNGYPKHFAAGTVCSASSLAIVIPPSITMIVFASTAGCSVGDLFIAGIIPGIIMGLIFIAYCYYFARKHNIRSEKNYSAKDKVKALTECIWALGVPIIILGGIYGGVFTPTEASTVAAVYAILVSMFIYKEMSLKELYLTCLKSALTTAQVMILVSAASTLSWVLTVNQVQEIFSNFISAFLSYPWIVLLIMNIILVLAGMFMDAVPFVLLLTPLFMPIFQQMGYSPIHLGMLMTVSGALGMYSPPFGLNIFVGMGVFKESFSTIARAVVPFVFLGILSMLLITFIPQLSLWLPALMRG